MIAGLQGPSTREMADGVEKENISIFEDQPLEFLKNIIQFIVSSFLLL